ncbi:MAG TPA: DUF6209 family protein [Bryobacteraceae bacterium]|nr:DUF6209 family protein [Bryobacteraceae bacterium]
MQRRFENRPAQISFTSDFHELLQGDLRPSAGLTLRYDPDRLVPPGDYVFGDSSWPITAHLRYSDQGPLTEMPLRGPVTPVPDRDPMGQGSMLTASTAVPAEARFVELWVSGQMSDGLHWDSDYGRNYWFRFPYADIHIESAIVLPRERGQAQFILDVRGVPEIERVSVRFFNAAASVPVRREEQLREAQRTAEGRRRWTLEDQVAPTSLVKFKMYYWIEGRRYKDDNSGAYYTADRPDLREEVPALPDALVAAARAWSEKLNPQ